MTYLLFLSFFSASAHQDRIERPKTYTFVFQNNDTVRLYNPSVSLLKQYSDDIINHKRKLIKAELHFETGETLIFTHDGNKWTSIKISNGKTEMAAPDTTIEKISEIHFVSVALLWDGNYTQAFSASYFYIQFDMGIEKSFDIYPELNLIFRENKFSNSMIWRQISDNSKQIIDF